MSHVLATDTSKLDGDVDPIVAKALQAQLKYDEEREKRLALGRDVNEYRRVEGPFANWLKDIWAEEKPRDPIYKETDVLILGGGFGSQVLAVDLLKNGIEDFTMVDKCGGFGGTWYWNRYPGAQCDIESFVYMPLLEETGYVPTEKYAHQPELLEHSERIAKHYDLYRRAIFQTEVLSIHWEEYKGVWRVITDRNDAIYARFVILNAGPLHRPKLPGTPGLEKFKGHAFHSSRFDKKYTGEDLEKLADKKVAIVGTGATAVQIIPHVGRASKEFYVIQRTPSGVDERLNQATDEKWIEQNVKEGWQKSRQDNFNNMSLGGPTDGSDLVDDNWTRVFRKMGEVAKTAPPEEIPKEIMKVDFERMESIRNRVDQVVTNKEVAEKLKPWYGWGCKRPTFHDLYLPTFNLPNVQLIDTEGRGVDEFTEYGFVVDGKEYKVDLIIFATGFELATDWVKRAGMDVYGRTEPLSQKWADGHIGLHSWGTHGFPNAFWIHTAQAPLAVNALFALHMQANHIGYIISEAMRRGLKYLEVTKEAEQEWLQEVFRAAKSRDIQERTCIPGWMNNEGKITAKHIRNWWYGGNGMEYFKILEDWRADGQLKGLKQVHF